LSGASKTKMKIVGFFDISVTVFWQLHNGVP